MATKKSSRPDFQCMNAGIDTAIVAVATTRAEPHGAERERKTVLREFFKREPVRKSWRNHEHRLLNAMARIEAWRSRKHGKGVALFATWRMQSRMIAQPTSIITTWPCSLV